MKCNFSGLETGNKKTTHPIVDKKIKMYGFTTFIEAMKQVGFAANSETIEQWMERVMPVYRQKLAALQPYRAAPLPAARGYFVAENGEEYEEYYSAGRLIVRQVIRDYDQYKG